MRRNHLVIGGLLAAYAAALAGEAWRLGITVDEPSHLIRAYMYWKGRTDFFPPDTPLTFMATGWVPRLLRAPLRQDTESWRILSSFGTGAETLRAAGAAGARSLFFLTRLANLVFPLLLVWLVWHWAGQLFSPATALAVAAATALEPSLLGHGALLKSDVAAAFAFVLLCYQSWRYWLGPNRWQLIRLVLCLLVAVLAKFSLVVCVPLAFGLVLWRGPRLLGAVLLPVALYSGLLAAYQLTDVRPMAEPEYQAMVEEGFSPPEIAAARWIGRLPWPMEFIHGFRFLGAANRNQGFPAYFLGRQIEYGATWYFPVALAIKVPIGLQLLVLAGLVALGQRLWRGEAGAADAFVWLPVGLVLGPALRSHIHMGLRHILPMLPLLILGAGFGLDRLGRHRPGRLAAGLCLAWLTVASVWIYPHGLAYFNESIGGPRNGWKYLADSNLDWGQDLPELARYVAANRIDKINLGFFGFDEPRHYLPDTMIEEVKVPWDPKFVPSTRFAPSPGLYAISVNILLGYFFEPEYREYFAYFKARPPDARAGWSIFIYHVK